MSQLEEQGKMWELTEFIRETAVLVGIVQEYYLLRTSVVNVKNTMIFVQLMILFPIDSEDVHW